MRTTKHEIAVSFEFDHGFETGTTIHRSCLPNFGLVSIRVLSGLLGSWKALVTQTFLYNSSLEERHKGKTT